FLPRECLFICHIKYDEISEKIKRTVVTTCVQCLVHPYGGPRTSKLSASRVLASMRFTGEQSDTDLSTKHCLTSR
uniref:Uncharacterized protein n=1 Tax=Paramormyrops kingsleyae TaxID=1676925 RepID=A0A3B3RSS7_9TELE